MINVFQDDSSQNAGSDKKPWEKNGNATNGNKFGQQNGSESPKVGRR